MRDWTISNERAFIVFTVKEVVYILYYCVTYCIFIMVVCVGGGERCSAMFTGSGVECVRLLGQCQSVGGRWLWFNTEIDSKEERERKFYLFGIS